MKKLVIAEKPSLARSICTALATAGEKFTACENNEYYSSENYYVVAQFGHLLSLLMPEEYDENKGQRAPLPYFPGEYEFKIKEGCEKRFKTIENLVNREDVVEIVHCGDADREGQLLVDLVLEKIGNTKPVTRPQFKALTPGAICSAFRKRTNNRAFTTVRDEGFARMIFDFDYGINLSNYATKKAHAKPALNVGRVKGAIMSELYDRELEIRNFKAEKYYKVISDHEGIKLSSKAKFEAINEAENHAAALQKGPTIVKDITVSPTTKKRPKLLSQTKLQAIMNKKYGYSPDKTLALAQSLYEKGLTTYPRTNTEYMTEEEIPLIEAIIKCVNGNDDLEMRTDKSVFDKTKVDGHSAIIITAKKPEKLSEDEMNCYMVIFNRFRAVFCKEPCVYNKTTVLIENPLELFRVTGETMVTPGWQTFEPPKSENINGEKKKKAEDDDEDNPEKVIPPLTVGQVLNTDFRPVERETKPPARYTVTTLGAWMENPFRKNNAENGSSPETQDNSQDSEPEPETASSDEIQNSDDDYRNILAGLEIGTEATRAGILKTLQEKKYISLKKSTYHVEPNGEYLVKVCRELGIDMSKEKTAYMGKTIKDVGKGKRLLSDAIKEEHEDITHVITEDRSCTIASAEGGMQGLSASEIGKCPLCGKPIRENSKAFGCSGWKDGCKFTLWKDVAGKTITKAQAKKILSGGTTSEIKGFTSKKGTSFDAKLKLKDTKDGVEFVFAKKKKKS